eukprot:233273_1
MQHTWFMLTAIVFALFTSSNGNKNYETCTHAVYSDTHNQAFCDFWYNTQSNPDTLELCDCKQNNGKYCTSWICIIVPYDFNNETKAAQILNKVLLPNNIDIYGVDECGYFTDDILISNNDTIPQWCYKYNDWQSCYCVPDDDNHCDNWVCHQYILDDDIQNDINVSIDILEYATQMSNEEYECTNVYINENDIVYLEACIEWQGTLVKYDASFSSMNCTVEAWNSDYSLFTDIYDNNVTNFTLDDLVDTIVYKWQCDEFDMSTSQFCRLCSNDTISQFICSSISDICYVVVEVAPGNTVIIIVATICSLVGCSLCVIGLVCLKKKCMKGRYGYLEGYELSKV